MCCISYTRKGKSQYSMKGALATVLTAPGKFIVFLIAPLSTNQYCLS